MAHGWNLQQHQRKVDAEHNSSFPQQQAYENGAGYRILDTIESRRRFAQLTKPVQVYRQVETCREYQVPICIWSTISQANVSNRHDGRVYFWWWSGVL